MRDISRWLAEKRKSAVFGRPPVHLTRDVGDPRAAARNAAARHPRIGYEDGDGSRTGGGSIRSRMACSTRMRSDSGQRSAAIMRRNSAARAAVSSSDNFRSMHRRWGD